jgi:long-chain fatty acid transport protein
MIVKKVLLVALLAFPSLVIAQGFQVNLQGQKQIGMAGGGTGIAMDQAAVFFNPGAVTMLKNNGFSAGVSPVFFKSAFQQSGSNITENNKNEVATPIQVYGVWGPKSEKYKIGLGVYTPFGGLNNWGDNWSGQYTITLLDLKAIFVQPTLSVKLTENIGIGAGFVYNHGIVDLQRRVPVVNENGVAGKATLKGSGEGFGWNAGIYIKTESGVSIGVTHRSKVVTKLNGGDAIFDVPASLKPTFPTKFDAQLPLPATTSIGFGFYPSPKTTIALDANWVHWHVYKSLDFDYDNNTRIADTKSPRNYSDGATIRLGIQQQSTEKLALRAGIGYAFTPVKEGYVTPEVPDANRLILSAGLGYNVSQRFGIDLSFLYEGLVKRTETNIETGLSGTFKSQVYIPGISLSYKW